MDAQFYEILQASQNEADERFISEKSAEELFQMYKHERSKTKLIAKRYSRLKGVYQSVVEENSKLKTTNVKLLATNEQLRTTLIGLSYKIQSSLKSISLDRDVTMS